MTAPNPPRSEGPIPGRENSRREPVPDYRFGRSRRLRDSREFNEAYDQNLCGRGRFMVIWLRKGPGASLRLGVVASRKVGQAHERARAKRVLRETYRCLRPSLTGEVDLVIVARRPILEATRDELRAELLRLVRRAGVLTLPAAAADGKQVRAARSPSPDGVAAAGRDT